MTKYSQAASDLENARGWWQGLTPQEQTKRDNFDRLVNKTEEILVREQRDWFSNMEEAMASQVPEKKESKKEAPPEEK